MRLRLFGYRVCFDLFPRMPPLAFSLEVRRVEAHAEPILLQVRYNKKSDYPLIKHGWTVRKRPVLTGGYRFGA